MASSPVNPTQASSSSRPTTPTGLASGLEGLSVELADSSPTKPPRQERRPPKLKKKRSEIQNHEPADGTPIEFVFEDGLRKVKPYFYTYNTFCKERWRDRSLVDIFVAEFRDRPEEYYREAIRTGTVAVNGKTVGLDYVVRNGDLISHTLHRHEPPVTADPIQVLHEDDEMMVIVKPAGVPVHPAGRYGCNSVVEILKWQEKQKRLADTSSQKENGESFLPRPCHRLDRLTSGIMFMAKTARAADQLSMQITSRTVRKEYIARVVGEFPEDVIVCDQPILLISPKLGLNRVRATGKTALTVFKRLAYYPPKSSSPQSGGGSGSSSSSSSGGDGPEADESMPWKQKRGYSIVRCLPVTGRTHQIRVHLQFLGHPIQNDPIYANQRVWGFGLGSGDADGTTATDDDIMTRLHRMGREEAADAVAYHDELVDNYQKRRAEKLSGEVCSVCDTPLYTDPGEQELSLWLHSLRYADANGAWGYTTPLPTWALPRPDQEGPREVGPLEELTSHVPQDHPAVQEVERR